MSVLRHLRSLSNMEFYKNAIKIRKELTIWMLKDFGAKRNYRSVRQVIKHISPNEQKVIDHIFSRYGRTSNNVYQGEYPKWFIDFERINVSRNLQKMVRYITSANSIYPTNQSEKDFRRNLQNKAICECYILYQELQYITSLFNQDLNRFVYLLEDIEKEVVLLKGWRQSNNKLKA